MKTLILLSKEKNTENPELLRYLNAFKVDIIELNSKNWLIRFLYCAFQTLRVLPGINKYDVVLSMSTMNGLTLSFFQKLSGGLIKPKHVIIDIALLRLLNKENKLNVKLAKFILSPAEKILCYSSIQKEALIDLLGFKDKIKFIPFGIETSKFSTEKSRPENYIICAGRAERDYNTLLNAIKDIDIELKIITGEDPISKNKGIPNAFNDVEVLKDVSFEEYKKLTLGSLFVVLPLEDTWYPTGQTVLLESMAMGKAVITTKTSGTIDYIEDGKTGLFVNPYDVPDLKEKINLLLGDPEKSGKIGFESKKFVEESFTLENVGKNIKEIFNSLS